VCASDPGNSGSNKARRRGRSNPATRVGTNNRWHCRRRLRPIAPLRGDC
jgi:hypothetical protein